MGKPNILWICTDQQRFDTLGCYGNEFVTTPNLDALAAGGVQFDGAYCQNPVCTPSRASFLTGRYPHTTGARQNGQSINPTEVLVVKHLADAGYDTGLSGKLHISACSPEICSDIEPRIDDGYREFHWSHHHSTGLEWTQDSYGPWLLAQGQTMDKHPVEGSEHVRYTVDSEYHQTTWCFQRAIDMIEHHADDDQPWLFSVNTFDPHHSFDSPREYLEPYLKRLDDIPLPAYTPGELETKPWFHRVSNRGVYGGPAMAYDSISETDHKLIRAAYWAMCDQIDANVGRAIEALERTGQRDNTLVIFHTDHGEMLGDHGMYLKGPMFYEPAVRSPLIINMPGTVQGGPRTSALVELVDLAPTLMEAAGMDVPVAMQGRSLWPLLTGQADRDRHRDSAFCESFNSVPRTRTPAAYASMVRMGRYKLTSYHGRNEGELYDLTDDPGEVHNLWASAAHADLRSAMMTKLADRLAFTMDPLPERQSAW
jgi:arylsulfatase